MTLPQNRSPRRPSLWWAAASGGLMAAVFAFAAWSSRQTKAPPPDQADPFPILPLSPSPYQNTTAAAHYVGSEACSACHPGETQTFRQTGMGRSASLVAPESEPPDGSFEHVLSNRRY